VRHLKLDHRQYSGFAIFVNKSKLMERLQRGCITLVINNVAENLLISRMCVPVTMETLTR